MTTKLQPSKRASSAIAAVLAAATAAGGYLVTSKSDAPSPPPEVELAMSALIKPWEGNSLKAYWDAYGKVWTICNGDTTDVRSGMIETPAGCANRLRTKLMHNYYPALKGCVKNWEEAPISWRAMMLSLSWNIGTTATCRSTAARLGMRGDYVKSCEAATAFNKAGNQFLIGLARRRGMGDATRIGEGELCVSGLD